MAVSYEWVAEQVTDNEFEDITDMSHWDTLAEARRVTAIEGHVVRIGLVRDKLDAFGDLDDRSWAYIEDGVLPEFFMDSGGYDSTRVPQRFLKEAQK